ncbi:Hypothetical protein P9211_05981 [Prochlorococcus marinus str. MIT 9211]|uniref:Uncharacterized protein n=2 Tax=Prochlorococcus marinus TaxID=1219 RepID=A9BEL9_PROM4|nr:Hypothetical protein P9211_05981 [Prochlorococcus marinus str. MIT 9211]
MTFGLIRTYLDRRKMVSTDTFLFHLISFEFLQSVSTATLCIRSFSLGKCILGQQGTGLPLLRTAMNYHLALIRKALSKRELLHQAELVLASKPERCSSAELNSRLIAQNAKKKKLHQVELFLASKPERCSSAELNSRLAVKRAQAKRLHSAQMISLRK